MQFSPYLAFDSVVWSVIAAVLAILTALSACLLLVGQCTGEDTCEIQLTAHNCLSSRDLNPMPLSLTRMCGTPTRDISSYNFSIPPADVIFHVEISTVLKKHLPTIK
ncbi:hypothetical protein EVAR_22208_1 [Eumeta japonica]|uniref:Uncharacterized protein n=1 Tax=Eumeta variegata TaxID=151549 RepID=A0A4C1UB57_EUMVA|nr:hypothetical protein EVAR_22208_1 [Eumeta japonica]